MSRSIHCHDQHNLVSHSSHSLTFELYVGVGILFCSSRISFVVFIFIFKLFSVIIVSLGVSTKYISAIAGMLNRLAQYVRLVSM